MDKLTPNLSPSVGSRKPDGSLCWGPQHSPEMACSTSETCRQMFFLISHLSLFLLVEFWLYLNSQVHPRHLFKHRHHLLEICSSLTCLHIHHQDCSATGQNPRKSFHGKEFQFLRGAAQSQPFWSFGRGPLAYHRFVKKRL